MPYKKITIATFIVGAALVLLYQGAKAQSLTGWKQIGTIKARNATAIKSDNWLIGCETLDRDYANYDAYKIYLVPLGIKRIRLQGGWAKTEKIKGQYDFLWLDHIINDAISRGLVPWLQLSYGNPLYPGGGGANLSAGFPSSADALVAWDKWVSATVEHYKIRVKDWEIWNEPNNIPENSPDDFAALTIRTIDNIKKIQPEARISALALGWIDLQFAEKYMKALADKNKLSQIDNITYHGYCKNPDEHYGDVAKLRAIVDKYKPGLKIRQGENGAPSKGNMGGAIADYDWTELSQAKWDTRRMLGDLGRGNQSSVFTIVDLAYNTDGPIKKLNVKGLLESDSTKKVIRRKLAYSAVQNVASLFDDQLSRVKNAVYENSSTRPVSVFVYQHKKTKTQLVTIWQNDQIPTNSVNPEDVNFTFKNARFINPVLVDMVSGKIYKIPASNWSRKGTDYIFKAIPVYDSPVLIADESALAARTNNIKNK